MFSQIGLIYGESTTRKVRILQVVWETFYFLSICWKPSSYCLRMVFLKCDGKPRPCFKRFRYQSYVIKNAYILFRAVNTFYKRLEWFSVECRRTKTKVITLASYKEHTQYSEPIKTRSNYRKLTQSAGKRREKSNCLVQMNICALRLMIVEHNPVDFIFTLLFLL